jgi:hypothetical protein
VLETNDSRGWTYIILIHRWTFNIFCLTTMQSLKCSKLTLIWKNENKLESLHIMANLTHLSM